MRKILTLFYVLVMTDAVAQTTYLTFDDALLVGFDHNPAMVAADFAEQAAHRERQAAIGLFMPRVTVKGTYTHFRKDVKIDLNDLKVGFSGALGNILSNPDITSALAPYLPTIQSGLSSLLGVDLSYTLQRRSTALLGGDITLPIFAGGKIWTANRAAKINEERTQLQSRQMRSALIVEMVERYFGVELARRAVAIREEAMSVVAQHLHDVVLLEKEGMAVESERLYAEYRLAEAERDLQRAYLQLETAQQALQTSLGVECLYTPSSPMFMLSAIESLDYFRDMAILNNPQIGEIGRVRELARMNLRLHRADFFPEVVAMGGMIFCDYQLTSLAPRMAVGIGLNFKLFDGLSREFRYSSARLQLHRVAALEHKAEQDILLLVEKYYNRVQSVLATVAAVERSERFAEEFLRAKRTAFREGMATSTDVVDATLNFSRARLERVQTAYEFDVALARLLEASGVSETFTYYMHSSEAQPVL